MPTLINPEELQRALTDGGEFALLDVRERGQYARGHLLLAINLPLSHLELRIRCYVPRLTARVILCDGGNGFSERAARVMVAVGYSDISIVEGGAPALRRGRDGAFSRPLRNDLRGWTLCRSSLPTALNLAAIPPLALRVLIYF